jgi:hypothetical protein
LHGIIQLRDSVLCKEEVLGQSFSTMINGIALNLYFPNIDDTSSQPTPCNRTSTPLFPPEFARSWKNNNQSIHWGNVANTRTGDAQVDYLPCSVDCPVDNEVTIAESLFAAITQWEERFIDYCILAGKTAHKQSHYKRESTSPLTLCCSKGVYRDAPQYFVELRFLEQQEFLPADKIREAIDFASSGREFLLEYQLLLASVSAKRNQQYKHAIFDACASIEICLNKVIAGYTGDNKNQKSLSKYRYLKDKFKFVETIDDDFPSIDYCKIVDYRNAIAHGRERIFSNLDAEEIIHYAEILLEHFKINFC